jgi:flagellar export protein FliJ
VKSRKKRMEKLIELRQEELDKQIKKLAETRQVLARAEARAREEAEREAAARAERQSLLTQAADAETWQRQGAWLDQREMHLAAARLYVTRSSKAVDDSLARVLEARRGIRQLEAVQERIRQVEQARVEKREAKLHDELASRRRNEG